MFQAFRNFLSSSANAANVNENNITQQIAEDRDSVDLSSLVESTEEFEDVLIRHSTPKVITRLSLTATPVTKLPPVIGKFVSIRELDLSSNRLFLLPWSIFYLQELENFNLSNNQIVELPKTLGYLKKLKIFDLRDNLIQFVPSELAYLDSLSKIYLEDNPHLKSPPIENLPANIGEFKSYLSQRLNRSDAFLACKYYYTIKTLIPSLLELSVRCIMDCGLEYLACTWVPPTLKQHINKEANDRDIQLHVMKCSKCKNYFSSKRTFEVHHC